MNNFTQNYPYRRKLIFIKQFIPQNIKLDPLILILFNLYNFSKHMILLCVIILFYHLMSTFLFYLQPQIVYFELHDTSVLNLPDSLPRVNL
jgi:hypothetical protein